MTDTVELMHQAFLAESAIGESDDIRAAIVDGLLDRFAPLDKPAERQRLRAQLWARIDGLGPLEDLLADRSVTEIMVNGDGAVWVEVAGVVQRSAATIDAAILTALVERILAPLGRRVDRSQPIVDARLPDGSRVCVVVAPVAVDGPSVTIRRFAPRGFALDDYAEPHQVEVLSEAIDRGANIVISGGTGSGKTSLLNALAGLLAPTTRVITIEDVLELAIPLANQVRLETRPTNADGVGQIDARTLLRAALRMRPDRIVVGEVRGGEALDMLQAMNTGHAGSLSTVHANRPADAVLRLETLCLFGDNPVPMPAVRAQIISAIDMLVQVERVAGGRRRVAAICEVGGFDASGSGWQLRDIGTVADLVRPPRVRT